MIYIYIYIERERERERGVYVCARARARSRPYVSGRVGGGWLYSRNIGASTPPKYSLRHPSPTQQQQQQQQGYTSNCRISGQRSMSPLLLLSTPLPQGCFVPIPFLILDSVGEKSENGTLTP